MYEQNKHATSWHRLFPPGNVKKVIVFCTYRALILLPCQEPSLPGNPSKMIISHENICPFISSQEICTSFVLLLCLFSSFYLYPLVYVASASLSRSLVGSQIKNFTSRATGELCWQWGISSSFRRRSCHLSCTLQNNLHIPDNLCRLFLLHLIYINFHVPCKHSWMKFS